jgi:hypothetical protein
LKPVWLENKPDRGVKAFVRIKRGHTSNDRSMA